MQTGPQPPGASLHFMWMHAVTLIGSNTFLFASSQSVTEGPPWGKPGCTHSPGSFDSGLRGLPDPGMNRDSSALATEIFISFYSFNKYSMNIF